MTPEKRFENQVRAWMGKQGIYNAGTPEKKMKVPPVGWYYKVWGGGMQKAGIPDIIACVNGVFVAIEVKSASGKPSDLQKLNIKRINEAGGVALVLYPAGFEQFKALLREVIQCDGHTQELKHLKSVHSSIYCDILKK